MERRQHTGPGPGPAPAVPLVYHLDDLAGHAPDELRALVGSKAANLAVMASQLSLPVPPGFVVSTRACGQYLSHGWPVGLLAELRAHVQHLEQDLGRTFGRGPDPLLVSVRSGAPVSMPGMMDTILNLGLTAETTAALAEVSGDAAFAADCRARFESLFTAVVGSPAVPADPWQQLQAAIEAVFRSWNSERARAYRRVEGIPDDLGTAVTVQAMVFGNRGPDSGTGVLFTRDPATGERVPYGDVLFQAQGEDVVAGSHHTEPVAALAQRLPAVAAQLWRYADLLERHFRDLCDIEFTIERGRLWLLQVRVGKRSPAAALRIAVEMAEDADFPLSRAEAVRRTAPLLAQPPTTWVGRPGDLVPITRGLPASPGYAWGEIATTPAAATAVAASGRPVLLVRAQTAPEDVPAMARAAGVLTGSGGLASHAAVVARGWGLPAVVGAAGLQVHDGGVVIAGRPFAAGALLSIDGTTGEVFPDRIPGHPQPVPQAITLLGWAAELGIPVGPAGAAPASGPASEAATAPANGPATGAGAGPAAPTADDVVRALSITGIAVADTLAATLAAAPEPAAAALRECLAAGLAESGGGGVRLTAAGEARAGQLLRADQDRLGPAAATAALDAFLALDAAVKEITTAWQLRPGDGGLAVNDHSDPGYDAAVLARLRAAHEQARAWLAPVAARLPRLAGYQHRLDRAVTAAGGDPRYVASPRVDSYHGIWFELHEDLIRLAGRTREEEVAAGRA